MVRIHSIHSIHSRGDGFWLEELYPRKLGQWSELEEPKLTLFGEVGMLAG